MDWKLLVLQMESTLAITTDSCLCLRCACRRNYSRTRACWKPEDDEDRELLQKAWANFDNLNKKRGLLFEVRHLWLQKGRSARRLRREQERSTVCMFFTSYHGLELLLLFDEGHRKFLGCEGLPLSDDLVQRLLLYYEHQHLSPYQPPLLSTAV